MVWYGGCGGYGVGILVGEVLWSYLVRIGRDLLSPTYNALATFNFDKIINTLVTIIEVHVAISSIHEYNNNLYTVRDKTLNYYC